MELGQNMHFVFVVFLLLTFYENSLKDSLAMQ